MQIFTDIVSWTGAVFISLAFLPQTIKTIKTKNTSGLSLTCCLIYHLGLTFFIIFSAYTKNWQLLSANCVGWIINAILIALIFYNMSKGKQVKNNQLLT